MPSIFMVKCPAVCTLEHTERNDIIGSFNAKQVALQMSGVALIFRKRNGERKGSDILSKLYPVGIVWKSLL